MKTDVKVENCTLLQHENGNDEITLPDSNCILQCTSNDYEHVKCLQSSPKLACDKTNSKSVQKTTKLDNDTPSNNDEETNTLNTQKQCDKHGISLDEALKHISLAYSPVTKQLHLVQPDNHDTPKTGESSSSSTLSHESSSDNLLSTPSSSSTFEETEQKPTFTSFLRRWTPSVKLFKNNGLNPELSNPLGSSALIQHPRPSNLPCKPLEEEVKHREEYKAILENVKRKEALNLNIMKRREKEMLKEEERLANTSKYFGKTVLPSWDIMKNVKKTRQLWWQGLPSNIRGRVWVLAIGNELNLTRNLYEICLQRAMDKLSRSYPLKITEEEQSLSVIQLDISRTFPHLGIFQKGGPYSEILHSLLAAYVCYRPDIGYVQGMSYIAAVLILNMESYEAFISFANLLNQPLHLCAFSLNQRKMKAYYSAFNEVFNANLPKLFSHFNSSGLTPDLYLLDWIYTVYAKAMPLDIACRIWDVFLRDGYEFLFRTAIGVLSLNKEVLLSMDFLECAQFLTKLPPDISVDLLFKSIENVSTNVGKITFGQIVEKYMHSDGI